MRILAALILAAFAFAVQAAVKANKANHAELETITDIGPALSGKLLDSRKAGEFKNCTDLVDRVGGGGPGNAKRFWQTRLTVNNVAYHAAAAPAAKATTGKSDVKAAAMPATSAKPTPSR